MDSILPMEEAEAQRRQNQDPSPAVLAWSVSQMLQGVELGAGRGVGGGEEECWVQARLLSKSGPQEMSV